MTGTTFSQARGRGSRASAGEHRDEAGGRRDQAADDRDRAGEHRDEAGNQRDQAAEARDHAAERSDVQLGAGTGSDSLRRSADERRSSASDRMRAAQDRRASARERTESEHDRTTALADRGASARERGDADTLRVSETMHRRLAHQLEAAQQIAGIGSWEWDISVDTMSWSTELCRILGVDAAQSLRTHDDYLARVHPDDRATVDALMERAVLTGQPFSVDHRVVRSDARPRIVHCRGEISPEVAGVAEHMTGTTFDVTDREEAVEALRRSERRLTEAQSTAKLGSWEWDMAADLVTWSDELYVLFGLDRANFVATYQGYLDHVHADDRELVGSTIGAALEAQGAFTVDHRVTRPGGVVAWLHSRGQVELGTDGRPASMSGTAADITERVELQEELSALAVRDELTGLHNRRGFVSLAHHQLEVAGRAGRLEPLLFIDLDGMKTINDTYGHAEGDRALVEVADFLGRSLRASDLVARVGGDEFCILLVDDGGGSKIDVDRVVAVLRSGPPQGQRSYPLVLSVGVAWLEPGSGTSVEALMDRADGAMYKDKSSKRRRARVMVVEDDADLRRLVVGLESSYEVVTAATGRSALATTGRMPDVVLLDLNLPDMDGAEVLRRLRVLLAETGWW